MTSTHCLLIFKSPMIRVDGISALPFADRAQQHTIHMFKPREDKSTGYISHLLFCPLFSLLYLKGKHVIPLHRGDLWCIFKGLCSSLAFCQWHVLALKTQLGSIEIVLKQHPRSCSQGTYIILREKSSLSA